MTAVFLNRSWSGITTKKTLIGMLMMLCFAGSAAIATENHEVQTIVIFGASGKIGSLIANEALTRGHKVIGVTRNPDRLAIKHEKFTAMQGDVTDRESFSTLSNFADSIVISVQGSMAGNAPEQSTHALAAQNAVDVLSNQKNAPYVIQVGGALSMFEDKAVMLQNLPIKVEEGSELYGMFFGHLVALNSYRASNVDWTVITPPLTILGWSPQEITDTKRTGKYRTSTTEFVRDPEGESSIYIADLAAAVIDELENRQFVRQRFTVGY